MPKARKGRNGPRRTPIEILDTHVPEDRLCVMLGMSPRTLRKYRQMREAPPYLILGRKKYYPLNEFRIWLESRIIRPVRRRAA